MSKINVLSSKVYNRIAAGEVVERPSSVVKELVENSLDAGATSIQIDILGGGISSIKITDNGSGIEKSELKKALLPHATSKISSVKDLDNIISLGFRGEALASIASVSKMTIVSKPENQQLGASIYCEGGDMGEVEDCGAIKGTEITVNNLFFNTPAREKFLRTERSEESDVSSMIAKFILCNNNVAFKYTADNKVIYQSYGDGFESAMCCVYGPDVIKDCFYIETIKNGIKINAYIGKHHFTKGNRSYQTTFVNGRYITNQTIASSIQNAYSSYLMKRQYPFYVLSLTVPSEIVDVNVHPNKLDVRFANNQIIYSTVYSVVSKVLDGSSEILNIVVDKNENNQLKPSESINNNVTHNNTFLNETVVKKVVLDKVVLCDSGKKNYSLDFDDDIFGKKSSDNKVDIFAENKAFLEKLEKEKQEKINNTPIQQTVVLEKDLKYIGQALNTFLIFEDGQDLYFVDQHAAHERILFDKLNDSLSNSEVVTQPLLLPFVLNVNSEEFDFLTSKIGVLASLGVEMSEFGKNAFKISAIPSFLTEMNLQKFFDDILSDLSGLKNITINELLMEKLAQKACKSAVKSGDKLSEIEIQVLIDKLKENIGLKCPHGRPVAIKITRTEIDKWFKRIV